MSQGEKEVQQLSELIMQTLETSGQLCSVKAMIRKAVFNVVNEEPPQKDAQTDKKSKYQVSGANKKVESKLSSSGKAIQNALKSEEERMALLLVKELLEYYQLDYTQNIFSNESNLHDSVDRSVLAQKTRTDKSAKTPLLVQIVQNAMTGKENTNATKDNILNSKDKIQQPTTTQKDSNPKKDSVPITTKTTTSKKIQPTVKDITTNKYSSTKFDNLKNISNNYESNEIDESMAGFEQLSDEDNYDKPPQKPLKQNKNQQNGATKKNPLFSSMDDTIGASMSHGQDLSVDSMKLEEDYDYYEDIA